MNSRRKFGGSARAAVGVFALACVVSFPGSTKAQVVVSGYPAGAVVQGGTTPYVYTQPGAVTTYYPPVVYSSPTYVAPYSYYPPAYSTYGYAGYVGPSYGYYRPSYSYYGRRGYRRW